MARASLKRELTLASKQASRNGQALGLMSGCYETQYVNQVSYNTHLGIRWLSVAFLIRCDDFIHLRLRIFQRLMDVINVEF